VDRAWGHPGDVLLALAAAILVAALFLGVYRPWHLRWGATPDEVAGAMPGDGELFAASFTATRAITVDAEPGDVWPWLVQVGFGRAGWYSYDWLDNLGRPSADRVLPELQTLEVGDWVPMSGKVDERTAFRVASFEPGRTLLWTKPDSTWSWVLRTDGGRGTRVVSRLRCRHAPDTPLGLAGMLLMELGDFPMFRKMLLNLKRRAEGLAAARRAGASPGAGEHRERQNDPGL
jgi:hypothetical protein